VKVLVIGAGVVGVATAYYLAEAGHEVSVVDRNAEAASEASWGNAGLVSPGDSYAWASPAALKTFIRSLTRRDLGIKVRPQADPRFYSWTLRFLLECTNARARINTLRKLRVTLYSRDCINTLTEATGIDYAARRAGILYFYRSAASLAAGAAHMKILADHGLTLEVVDRDRLVALDPALAASGEGIAGGIHSPMDQTGDSCRFARALAAWCEKERSVRFLWKTPVAAITHEAGRVAGVRTSAGTLTADAYVLAAGADSPLLARPLGIALPICPVKGYSVTVPVAEEARAPRLGGVDEDRLVAYSRLGEKVRIAATAEFAGYDRSHRPADFQALLATARELFGGGLDLNRAAYWAGLRPMTPSSVPILGPTRLGNLHLNVGHGHVGWTMACGTGKVVADLLGGRKPEIDMEGLLHAA
jgi:D-amino-acid dehydrogenase